MAFRLMKDEAEKLERVIAKLRDKANILELEHQKCLETVTDAIEGYNDEISELNKLVADAMNEKDEILSRFQMEFDSRSDKWKESEAGNSADVFLSQWDNFSADEFDTVEVPEIPEIHESVDSIADELDNLPREVESE